jgi:hypothetical protein
VKLPQSTHLFHEDACRTRHDHAPQNLNIVRKIAMNLLRLNPLKKTLSKKRLRACLDRKRCLRTVVDADTAAMRWR